MGGLLTGGAGVKDSTNIRDTGPLSLLLEAASIVGSYTI